MYILSLTALFLAVSIAAQQGSYNTRGLSDLRIRAIENDQLLFTRGDRSHRPDPVAGRTGSPRHGRSSDRVPPPPSRGSMSSSSTASSDSSARSSSSGKTISSTGTSDDSNIARIPSKARVYMSVNGPAAVYAKGKGVRIDGESVHPGDRIRKKVDGGRGKIPRIAIHVGHGGEGTIISRGPKRAGVITKGLVGPSMARQLAPPNGAQDIGNPGQEAEMLTRTGRVANHEVIGEVIGAGTLSGDAQR